MNSRLLDPVHGVSDGVIGTILAFACFSVSRFLVNIELIENSTWCYEIRDFQMSLYVTRLTALKRLTLRY